MSLNTYLYFEDNCREAFEFYRSIFGGEFSALQTFADDPSDSGALDEVQDRIMHISLPVGDSVLMGSDSAPWQGTPTVGDNVVISYAPDSRDAADHAFSALSDGGEVRVPISEQFWGAYFGSCRDRFGVNWMINYELSQE